MGYTLEELIEYVSPERYSKISSVLENRTNHISVVMENFYDPHNVSAVIRTCDAFGIQNAHVIELDNKFHVSKRVCRGTENWVNIYKYQSSLEAIQNLKKTGYKVYFADPRQEYPMIEDLPLDDKAAIIFGQEKRGITDETKKYADGGFRIPIYGFVESFNVSVSCALSIYSLTSRLHQSGDRKYFLNETEKEKLLKHWLIKNTSIGNTLRKIGKEKEFLMSEPYLTNLR